MSRLLPSTFVLLLLLLKPIQLKADYLWTPNCISAYEAALQLNFTEAERLISIEKNKSPENLIPVYVESQIDFLKSFIYEQKDFLDAMKDRNDARIHLFEKHKGKSPHQRFCIAEMYLQQAIARIKFKEFFGAAYEVRKAYKTLEDNNREYPEFKPNLRGLGLIHAAVGSIPKNYQWLAGMLGLGGTIKQGLNELKILLNTTYKEKDYAYLRDETIILITFLELNLGKEKDHSMMRKRFLTVKDLPSKPLMIFSKALFHVAIAENDSIIHLLENRKQSPGQEPLNYLHYMEANARLNNLDPAADECFLKYINKHKGKSYILSSWQRLGWSKLIRGDKEGYKSCLAKISEMKKGDDFTDEDKSAMKEAASKEEPNTVLLRARLLFDGGYYQRALTEIAGKPMTQFPRLRDQLELTYRLARIFDRQEKDDKAIEYYELTLKNGINQTYYFAANSALMLGQIYEARGDKTKAAAYYKKTLEMRDHEFQNSIDQKAKSGLNRLEIN